MNWIHQLHWFVPAELRQSEENERRSLLVVIISLMMPLWGPVFSVLFAYSGSPLHMTLAPSAFGAMALTVPFLLRATGSLALAGNLFVAIFMADLTFFCWFDGGFDSPGLVWMFIIPMIVSYVAGLRSGIAWTAVVVAEIAGFYTLGQLGWLPPAADAAETIRLVRMLCSCAASVSMLGLVAFNEKVRDKLHRTIVEQQAGLLHAARMTALGEMSGGVAHEINNPLAIITMHAERAGMLGKSCSEPGVSEKILFSVDKILASSSRVSTIVKGLLAFSKDTEGEPAYPEPVSGLVRGCLDLCREKLLESGIEVRGEGELPSLAVSCRRTEVIQMLLHLISNSNEAIGRSASRWIRFDARQMGQFVEISVVDSGPGIAKEYQEKLFQPFFTTKSLGQGPGLGLSICKGLAEAQGGSIQLDPTDANTRFVIRLPQA